jgi:iron uptake system EfeUOB component EfeO/EfeM
MSVVAQLPSTNVSLWREYRLAFQEFARKAQSVQSLKDALNPARASIDDALIDLERARLHYNNCRDALASALLPNSKLAFAAPREHVQHIREFAQLLWDLDDRRDGRADDDWYRAEKIVRSAAATTSHQLTTA